LHGLTDREGYGSVKDGAIEDKGVEFAVFANRIDVLRKVMKEGFVQFAPHQAGIEKFCINAHRDGAEASRMKSAD
jgi:hypothetical protein